MKPLRTLGIDIAGPESQTGLVEMTWNPAPVVVSVDVGKHDSDGLQKRIDAVLADKGWVAIDAPFGFPEAFSKAVSELGTDGRVNTLGTEITWRATEQVVRERLKDIGVEKRPLSTVSQMITGTVVRTTELVSRFTSDLPNKPIDKIGTTSGIVETYPIACLLLWRLIGGPNPTSASKLAAHYKAAKPADGVTAATRRSDGCHAIEGLLREAVPSLAHSDEKWLEALRASGDAIDAAVCALVAGVVARRDRISGTTQPADKYLGRAKAEGWIHLPTLDQLQAAASEVRRP